MATDPLKAVGRRKEAVARVRLSPGEGRITINDREFREYFPRRLLQQVVVAPLKAVDAVKRYDVAARVEGGGVSGQAGAVVQGIARALVSNEPELRATLKSGGFLTRDARAKERKKPGLKRARKAPQYTKR
ncbi:MAG TPA: 30S ribosomal protein S9 [Candidatus Dormibacteraeota bacterium]|nr:30S ribosomal protein S9 [Candidatus Dormibacteraeota bacterium]